MNKPPFIVEQTLSEKDLIEITPPRVERMFDFDAFSDGMYEYRIPPLRMSEIELTTTVDLRPALQSGRPIAIKVFGMTCYGYVTYITVHTELDPRYRPFDEPTRVVTTYKVKILPTGRPIFDSELPAAKEDSVKIFEGVVVKLDEKKEPASVEQVVAPFVAETLAAAKETVLVDFAADKQLKGKDLAGYSVRIREFQAGL